MVRNPRWSRDELIIALDFYVRHAGSIPGKKSAGILEVSGFLKRLRAKLGGATSGTYRNANSVYMKLMNFRRFDGNYESKGLQRGNRDEEIVWKRYISKKEDLRRVAEGIRASVASDVPVAEEVSGVSEGEEEGDEGQVLTRVHRYRERDTKLVNRKKEQILRRIGALRCEVCGFDFSRMYGERGRLFIECHHAKPLADLRPGERTRLSDLRLLCANCHRMIHRKRPWLSVEELQRLVGGKGRSVATQAG